jgi:hypothetical protein
MAQRQDALIAAFHGGEDKGAQPDALEIDEVDNADSLEDAEDVWLPVLAALQHLLNPGGYVPPGC